MTLYIQKSKLEKILFLDIETVSGQKEYNQLGQNMKKLWSKKAKSILRYSGEDDTEEAIQKVYKDKAAIFAEFAKVICISVGYLRRKNNKDELRIKSFYGNNEKELLEDFRKMIDAHFDEPSKYFICGHNVREFDVPFLGRRMLVNGIQLPKMFNLIGKKPWETKHIIDTLEMWKFGDYKNYVSLDLLANIFGISSSKSKMDGSQVGEYYWEKDGLEDIKEYCELDVVVGTKVFMKLNGMMDVNFSVHR